MEYGFTEMYNTSLLSSKSYNFEYFQRENVCRLCWSENALINLTNNILDPGKMKSENNLIMAINECLNIDVNDAETAYPNKVCDSCCSEINRYYCFKNYCREADRRLREIFKIQHELLLHSDKIECEIELDLKEDSIVYDLNQLEGNTEKCVKRKVYKYKKKCTPTYCKICKHDYECTNSFTEHNSKYHGIENGVFKCFGCEKKFTTRKNRRGHEENHCKGLTKGYECSHCSRFLPNRTKYEAHMRFHRDNVKIELPDDIFNCRKCELQFNTKEKLKNHMLDHSAEKKCFVCESCGRVFTRKDYLIKHMLIHTGEKHHRCPHCGFLTTQRSSLTVHIRKHTGERPYKCSVCPMRFVTSSNFRKHQKTVHVDVKDKPYECAVCGKKFSSKCGLQQHMSTHAPTLAHSCRHCGAAYSRARSLRRHVGAKHKAEEAAVEG